MSNKILLCADSFLVRDHQMRARNLHEQRFYKNCESLGLPPPYPSLWDRALSYKGLSFPRIQAIKDTHTGEIFFEVIHRKAPPLCSEIHLDPQGWVDKRSNPLIKGPDMDLLASLRIASTARGYDDCIIITDEGSIKETAHANLLWWDEGIFYYPSLTARQADKHSESIFPGVTLQAFIHAAEKENIPVRAGCIDIPTLLSHSHWALNSLHGARAGINNDPHLNAQVIELLG